MVVYDYSRKIWPEVIDFVDYISGRILDLGCGNGNLTAYIKNKGLNVIGVDVSQELLNIAKKKCKAEFIKADMTKLPFNNDYFDNILVIASFHHLEDNESRIKALNEIKRVLKPSGHVLMSVWDKHAGQGDKVKNWGGEPARFYYFFDKDELIKLVESSGLNIIWFKHSGDNFFLELSK